MKEKLKEFFVEKKELFIFIGVITLVLGTVLGISLLSGGERSNGVANTNSSTDSTTNTTQKPNQDTTTEEKVIFEKMILPIEGEYTIVRYFFDVNDTDVMQEAVMQAPNYFKECKGVSFAKEDNSSFDCIAIFSGVVEEVTEDSLEGKIVTILHDNNIRSIYKSLSEVTVNEGDNVKIGTKIGVAGNSLIDSAANVHVHLEILNNGTYINPINAYNKELTEIAAEIK